MTTTAPPCQWETSDYPPDYPSATASTWKRAARRLPDVQPGPGLFLVHGRTAMSDEYPVYEVRIADYASRRLVCTCKTHLGGESRASCCTHRMAVSLWCHQQGKSPDRFIYESLTEAGNQSQSEPQTYLPEQTQFGASGADLRPIDPLVFQATAPEAPLFFFRPPPIPSMVHAQPSWCKDVSGPAYSANLRATLNLTPRQDHAHTWMGIAPWDVPAVPHPSRWAPYAPHWLTQVRPHQWEAIQKVCRQLVERGVRMVFADMPTGAGKTLLGVLIWAEIRMLEVPRDHNYGCEDPDCGGCWHPLQALYLCTTKQLQDQAAETFDYAVVLKGKDNYPTANFPEKFQHASQWEERISCKDCQWDSFSCYLCDAVDAIGEPITWSAKERCPYSQVVRRAMKADLVITNPSYALPAWNGQGNFRDRFVIWDEGDTQENSLLDYVSVELSVRVQDRLGVQPPAKRTVPSSWSECLVGAKSMALQGMAAALQIAPAGAAQFAALGFSRAALDRPGVIRRIVARLEEIALELLKLDKKSSESRKLRREQSQFEDLLKKTKMVEESLSENWVYTGYEDTEKDPAARHPIEFKPIKATEFAEPYCWKHGRFFLVESGTLIDPSSIAADLGLQPMDHGIVVVPSTFPVPNRTINYLPVASNTSKNQAIAEPLIGAKCRELAEHFLANGLPGLIHTVTYRFNNYLVHKALKGLPIITYEDAKGRIEALRRFEKYGGILLAPSMERGVDLKDDLCRWQIIPKIPYMYLGSKQVSQRVYGTGPSGQEWYARKTIESLCQMTGRIVRSDTDWGYTYILDQKFESFFREHRARFPGHWAEAVVDMSPDQALTAHRRGRRR